MRFEVVPQELEGAQSSLQELSGHLAELIELGRRLASFSDLWRNARSRYFILIWVALNAAVPLFPLFTGAAGVQIAWQAHLGGFLVGLLLVPLFERREGAG